MNTLTTRLGIDVERHNILRLGDPAYRAWTDLVNTCVTFVFEMTPLDEGLTRWEVERFAIPWRIVDNELVTYRKILHTPPARPEWLDPRWTPTPTPEAT